MPHVQQQIIDALQAALTTAGIVEKGRVYVERVDPLPEEALPALMVQEAAAGEKLGPLSLDGVQERAYAVDVACAVQNATGYGAQARELGLKVEQLLGSEGPEMQDLIDLCEGGIYLASSRMAISGEGNQVIAVRVQVWIFTYHAHQASPDSANFSPLED